MKHLFTITAVIAALAGSAFAGPASPSFKKTVMEPRPEVYGLGWYGALQAGVNAFQNTKDLSGLPAGFSSDIRSEVGGFGGGKIGYVFNTGKIRPALEGDLFYNGFGYTGQINAGGGPFGAFGGSVNSFAYMANAIVRFDLGRFQPYVGAGIGGYWASIDVDSFAAGIPRPAGLNRDNSSWAWQIVAGADYYFTERVSIFGEYKYLTYMDFTEFGGIGAFGVPSTKTDLDQHLFGIGVRLHF